MLTVIGSVPKRALRLCLFAAPVLLIAASGCGGSTSISSFTAQPDGGSAAGQGGGVSEAGAGGAVDEAGAGGTGGLPAVMCPSTSITSPLNGAVLTAADDAQGPGGDSCSDGFQHDVTVKTSAADGATATLFSGTNKLAVTKVKGGVATFSNTQLSIGNDSLQVQIGDATCLSAVAKVSISCNGAPTCDIAKPVISPTHPELNGVPVAQGGDRVSAAGSAYQAAFEVTTDVDDGQLVTLQVNSNTSLATPAKGGKADFGGVTLVPDGDFSVVATCTASTGKTAKSAPATFTVDTTPPDLTVTQPTMGQHFGPTDDSDATTAGQQFQVCATTDSTDALNLPGALGAAQKNFCVGIGTATPTCVAATGSSTGAPCVTLTCQDRAAFNLNVSLSDGAGNSTTSTIQGISCTSTLPSVAIIDPVDGTGADVNTHILAASATSTRKDADATKPGAQFTVVACTDVQNAAMTLLGGIKGQPANSLATTTSVTATAGDNCPSGKGYVGRFTAATLPESSEGVLGTLTSPTELTVTVSDQGTLGTSPAVDVWVDSSAPSISSLTPSPLCGALIQSTTAVAQSVKLITSSVPVVATLTNALGTSTFTATTADIGQANLGTMTFAPGQNDIVATTVDPAGNPGALQSPCTLTVGNPPVMSWRNPNVAKLNVANDSDPATAGWQGMLSVQTDLAGTGATVQFSTGAGNLGAPIAVDASGIATTPSLTIPDSASVSLTATTSDVTDRGTGTISLTVVVDTQAPNAIADLAATIPAALRRQTTFHLAWTAPTDPSGTVASYDVRVAKGIAITSANFDAQERVAFSGSAAAAGSPDSVDVANRLIENDYYFAVAPIDKGGNRGPMAFVGPTTAHFNQTLLAPGNAAEMFGYTVDGSTSLDGDAYSDLVVGAYNSQTVYIYMGSATGYTTTPTATIVGSSVGFGRSVAVIGDIDSDGLPDLAVSSPIEGGGNVYIFKGRHVWPSLLQQADADYVVQSGAGFAGAFNGYVVARVGDFNSDGVDDFALSAPFYGGGAGRVSVVYGVPSGTPFGTVSLPADYGTRALAIDTTGGDTIVGLGRYYPNGGSTMTVSDAVGSGSVVAFHGTGQVGPISSADQTLSGPLTQGRTGVSVAFFGGGSSLPVIGVGSPAYTSSSSNGQVDLFGGVTATGPFSGTHAIYTDSRATNLGDGFGASVMGGAYASGVTTSLIGDSAPDVVVGALREGGASTHVYILTGQNALTAGTRDIVQAADVSIQMPADWVGCSPYSAQIRDANGDSYGDLAIGEWRRTSGFSGRVLILW